MSNRQIKQILFIAPTSQRCNEIKKEYANTYKFIKTLTLSQLQNEIFEKVVLTFWGGIVFSIDDVD
jgi:hypothetical protein